MLSLQTTASEVDWLQLVSKWFRVFINALSFKQVTSCSMHSIVTTFREAVIKVEVANFCAAMDTLIDQDNGFDVLSIKVKIFRKVIYFRVY